MAKKKIDKIMVPDFKDDGKTIEDLTLEQKQELVDALIPKEVDIHQYMLITPITENNETESIYLDQAEESPYIPAPTIPGSNILPVHDDIPKIPAELKPGEFVIRQQTLPTRPVGESITIAPTAPAIVQPAPVPTRKADIKKIFQNELIDKNVAFIKPQLVTSSTAPRTALNYSRRNVALLNDINNIINTPPMSSTDNPVNRESRGVFRINKNKPIKN